MPLNDWHTPLPADLNAIHEEANRLALRGIDVHTVTIILNGQHGGWDVTLGATDRDLQDATYTYIQSRYGALEKVR